MGRSREDKSFLHLFGDVPLLSQYKGFENSRVRKLGLLLQEMTDMISPTFDLKEHRVFKSLTDFNPTVLYRQKSDGVNLLKGEMTLVREYPRVSKSVGGMKPAD